jgi:hypothetical protein
MPVTYQEYLEDPRAFDALQRRVSRLRMPYGEVDHGKQRAVGLTQNIGIDSARRPPWSRATPPGNSELGEGLRSPCYADDGGGQGEDQRVNARIKKGAVNRKQLPADV